MYTILKNYQFEEIRGTTKIIKEPAGVCGFITPWNWPVNQIYTLHSIELRLAKDSEYHRGKNHLSEEWRPHN